MIPTGTVGDWIRICDQAEEQRSASVQSLSVVESSFQAYQVREGGNPSGLFTDYYEASLQGSWEPGGAYTVPLYTRPDDLIPANLGSFREEWDGSNIVAAAGWALALLFPRRDHGGASGSGA